MAKGEEGGKVKHLVPAVPNIDVFTVKCSPSFSSVVQESRVILESLWEGERELGRGICISEEYVGDCVSSLIASIPLGDC